MEQSLGIVQHTPLWVFLVLALLIVTGVQALRPRDLPMWRILIVPAVFIAWGVVSVAQRSAVVPMLALDWVVAAAVGGGIAWATTRLAGYAFDGNGGSVHVPGSPLPLVRNTVIFIARYGLAVGAIFAATAAAHAQLILLDVLASGLTAGYFLGWLARFSLARRALVART